MLGQILGNKYLSTVLGVSFMLLVVLFGFSSYTSQAISKKVSQDIYSNPSQIGYSELAYVPNEGDNGINEETTLLVTHLYEVGAVRGIICESRKLSAHLENEGLPAIYVTKQSNRVHEQAKNVLGIAGSQTITVLASADNLEKILYTFKTNGVNASGLVIGRGDEQLPLSNHLSKLLLYIESRVSKPNPLITNPRYTLNIQH